MAKRRTFYRLNSEGQVETTRRVQCPAEDGWSEEKIKPLAGAKKADPLFTPRTEVEELQKQVFALQQAVRELGAENKKLKEALNKDASAKNYLAERRLERDAMELERTAEFARHNCHISEDAFFAMKTKAQGLETRLQAANERIEVLQQALDRARNLDFNDRRGHPSDQ